MSHCRLTGMEWKERKVKAVYKADGSAELVADKPVSLAEIVAEIPALWLSGLPKDHNLVVKRFRYGQHEPEQVDRSRGLNVLEAAVAKENLVAVYKAEGYEVLSDLDLIQPGQSDWVRIYIAKEAYFGRS